jgi:DNA-binding transcriptional regulator YdaS (Cro superfamily)
MDKDLTPIERAVYSVIPTTQTELASRVGVSVQMVNQWVKQRRPVPIDKAVEIEIATGGKVKAEELNPKVARIRGTV